VADDKKHGYRRYRSDCCRCATCRAGHAEKQRQDRAANRLLRLAVEAEGRTYTVAGITHGRSGYDHHQCRCDTCIEAQYTYNSSRIRRRYRDG
jgi:hypothetical protein